MAERSEQLPRWGHGDADTAELRRLGVDPARVLDFAVNVNPLGADPAVLEAVRAVPLDRYPDARAILAREALAVHLDLPVERIALGNGAAELLFTLVHALGGAHLRVAIAEPTFSELGRAARVAGAQVRGFHAPRSAGYAVDVEALARDAHGADLLYLCNPNNPTGRALPHEEVEALCRALPTTTVVVDQAFLSLSTRHEDARRPLPDNALALRSLTKDHALAGLRVAYVVGAPALLARVERARPTWTVSSLAQAAVIATCRSTHVARTRPALLDMRHSLAARLHALGVETLASDSIFLMARVGDAAALRERLLREQHVAVRDCASFGLPDHIRLCARPSADVDRLIAALEACRG